MVNDRRPRTLCVFVTVVVHRHHGQRLELAARRQALRVERVPRVAALIEEGDDVVEGGVHAFQVGVRLLKGSGGALELAERRQLRLLDVDAAEEAREERVSSKYAPM